MTGQEALTLIDRLLQTAKQQGLNDLQSAIILAVWEGHCYQVVADRLDYEVDYIKQIAARLWKQIARLVGEDVSKCNLQSVLHRYQKTHEVRVYNRIQDWGDAINVAHFYNRQGDIQVFLAQGRTVFSNQWELLEEQFQHLSTLQQRVMYWFAINREGITPVNLQAKLLPKLPLQKLLDILEALHERSLIETTEKGLSQQPVIMEYVTEHFLQRIEREIIEGKLNLFRTHTLIEV